MRSTTMPPTARLPRRRTYRPIGRSRPALRFSPYAWAKLLFLRDHGPTEIGGFGLSADGDPLLVEDLRLVRQACTAVSVAFDDGAVADYFDECVDAGLAPERFVRVWVHTHPGESPRPSDTDERTFERAFGGCDWAVIAVLAGGGASYARLRFTAGPRGDLLLPVEVDFAAAFAAADPALWAEEYARCVADESGFGLAMLKARDPAAAADLPEDLRPLRLGRSDFTDLDPRTWEFHDEYAVLDDRTR